MRKKILQRKLIALLVIIFIVVAGFAAYAIYRFNKYNKEAAPAAVSLTELSRKTTQETGTEAEGTQTEDQASLPKELNLKVAFYSQAPFGNWDYPWQEACEEASILLVANEYLHKNWTSEEFNNQILKLVAWENKVFGYYTDTTMREVAKMLKDNFNLDSVIHENPTYEEIQEILAKGHLIIMTFAGKEIGNPNYKNGGPLYHAMVIKGYKEGEKLITNDVGTRRGADYVYDWKTLQNALHDWTIPIDNGAKRMIEVLPPAAASPSNNSTQQ
jgi:hypothetical protein